jgi:hypothetical protein
MRHATSKRFLLINLASDIPPSHASGCARSCSRRYLRQRRRYLHRCRPQRCRRRNPRHRRPRRHRPWRCRPRRCRPRCCRPCRRRHRHSSPRCCPCHHRPRPRRRSPGPRLKVLARLPSSPPSSSFPAPSTAAPGVDCSVAVAVAALVVGACTRRASCLLSLVAEAASTPALVGARCMGQTNEMGDEKRGPCQALEQRLRKWRGEKRGVASGDGAAAAETYVQFNHAPHLHLPRQHGPPPRATRRVETALLLGVPRVKCTTRADRLGPIRGRFRRGRARWARLDVLEAAAPKSGGARRGRQTRPNSDNAVRNVPIEYWHVEESFSWLLEANTPLLADLLSNSVITIQPSGEAESCRTLRGVGGGILRFSRTE